MTRPRVVEHWWNQRWGKWNRRIIRLQVGDSDMGAGIWQLRIEWGGYDQTFDYRTEEDARTELELLLSEYGPWKQFRINPEEGQPAS